MCGEVDGAIYMMIWPLLVVVTNRAAADDDYNVITIYPCGTDLSA